MSDNSSPSVAKIPVWKKRPGGGDEWNYAGRFGNNLFQYVYHRLLASSRNERFCAPSPLPAHANTMPCEIPEGGHGSDTVEEATLPMRGSPDYCNDVAPLYANQQTIRKWFAEGVPELSSLEPLPDNEISLHVRLGDTWVIRHGLYPQFPARFWTSAIQNVHEREGWEGGREFVINLISDQPNHPYIQQLKRVLENYFPACSIQNGGGTQEEDWKRLYRSRHVVASCSTFSFWSTFLSPHVRNMIVPRHGFFASGHQTNPVEFDSRWQTIETTHAYAVDYFSLQTKLAKTLFP
jgi:hypothetical protein